MTIFWSVRACFYMAMRKKRMGTIFHGTPSYQSKEGSNRARETDDVYVIEA